MFNYKIVVFVSFCSLVLLMLFSQLDLEDETVHVHEEMNTEISDKSFQGGHQKSEKKLELLAYKKLFDESHYEAVDSKGVKGLKELTALIEESVYRDDYLFKKLLANTYRLLAFDKSIPEGLEKVEFKSKSKVLYEQLWSSSSYSRDVAENLFDLLDNSSQKQEFVLEVLKKDPNNPVFLRWISYRYLSNGELDKSISSLRRAYENESNFLYKKIYGNELVDLFESNHRLDQLKEFQVEFNDWVNVNE